MVAPTAPDLTSITTAGLNQAGYATPTTAQLTKAQDYWMREIKNDLAHKKLKSLHTVSFLPTVIGRHRYSNPTNHGNDMTLTLLDGEHIGVAQAGSSSSITLAAAEGIVENAILGRYILITSETGVGSCSQCTAYDTTTKIATVSPNFTTAPAVNSDYMVVDAYYPLTQIPAWDVDMERNVTDKGRPAFYIPIGDADYGEILLYPTPDAIYGLPMRYYA